MIHSSAAVRTKRLLLCHRPQWIRAAASQPAAAGRPTSGCCNFFFFFFWSFVIKGVGKYDCEEKNLLFRPKLAKFLVFCNHLTLINFSFLRLIYIERSLETSAFVLSVLLFPTCFDSSFEQVLFFAFFWKHRFLFIGSKLSSTFIYCFEVLNQAVNELHLSIADFCDVNCLCLKHLFIYTFIDLIWFFHRRPSSMSLWRWTSWTLSLKTTSKWRFAEEIVQSHYWLETDWCWCWCLVCWCFSFFKYLFFCPTSNFLSHTDWTDKEKNDRRRDGQLHNIHASEIPGWGNLDFYFTLFSPCWRIFGPFCDCVRGKFSTLCWPECRPPSATLTRARGPTATRRWRGRTTGKTSPAREKCEKHENLCMSGWMAASRPQQRRVYLVLFSALVFI